MLKNPDDRRARRSRRLLKESLLTLMKQKSFSEISVRDVTDEADMNRGTFYLHYTGTADLLQNLEADLLEEIQDLVDAHISETMEKGTVRPLLEPVLDFVVAQRETCEILFRGNEASNFVQALQQLIQNGVLMQYPAENHGFDAAVLQKIPQQTADIVHDHPPVFLVGVKGRHRPTPVPVQPGCGRQQGQ